MTPRVRVPLRNRQTRPGTRPGTRTVLAVVAFALALPALLLLGLATPTDTDSKSIMVVRYACMACQSAGLQRRLLFHDLPAGGVPLREQCSVQPVCPGHSHCGTAQQAH